MIPLELREAIATAIKCARSAAPAAALASGLFGGAASGAPGDLDPSFGNVGRAYPLPDLSGPAWSLQVQDDDDIILAGGDYYTAYYDYYSDSAIGFTQRLSDNGSIDQTFAALALADTEVRDVAVQPDGKVIGVGRTVQGNPAHFVLTVFRLDPGGALDPSFGDGGIVRLGVGEGPDQAGTSIALDSDGRIVVAGLQGTWGGPLIVARFLASGTLDAAFGVDGKFIGPVTHGYIAHPKILRTSDGRYRVTTNALSGDDPAQSLYNCRVLGLTANGAVDTTFGNAGFVGIEEGNQASVTCRSLAALSNDRMLVAGSNSGHGMLVRLLGNGAKDASFAAPAVAAGMVAATALGTADDGSVVVAGRGELGVSGSLIVRLQANGQLDSLFGSNGSTWIDLPSDLSSYRLDPTVHDIAVLPDGRVLLAGEDSHYGLNRPFVARLLGTGGGNGPGVLGIERHDFTVKEEDQNAVINVRRMGGRSGTVSVGYRTRTMPTNPSNATPGQDFTAVVGRLTWADGDASDKQIIVPIASGDSFEGPEYFSVGFDDLQGGAGLGIVTSTVQIAAGEGFLGFLTIDGRAAIVADEGGAYAELSVMYDAREPGAVSVKLQMGPEDAKAGSDFVADPITVSWPEGASGSKLVRIPIVDDNRHERRESFTVSLVDPTAGAVLAEPNKTTITIQDDDPESSGGGSFGFPSLLLLGAGVLLRRLWGRPRRSGALGGTPGVNFQPVAPRPGTRSGG